MSDIRPYLANRRITGFVGRHLLHDGTRVTWHAGKDTVAEMLIDELRDHGIKAVRLGFADALYEEIACAFHVTPQFVRENKKAFGGLLQHWGTDVRRALWGEDYWVRKAAARIPNLDAQWVLITDVRFPDEEALVRKLGGSVVRVYRESHEPVELGSRKPGHRSEAHDPDNVDHQIWNTGSLDDLRAEVRKYLGWELATKGGVV